MQASQGKKRQGLLGDAKKSRQSKRMAASATESPDTPMFQNDGSDDEDNILSVLL